MNLFHLSPTLLLIVWLSTMPSFGQTPNQKQARNTYYSKVQSNPQNFAGFSGFVNLFEKKASIPQELISQYTYLPNTRGSFKAAATFKLKNGIQILILHQKTRMCVKQYMLTSNGDRILHHSLVGEKCVPAPGATTNEFSYFSRNSNGEMTQTHYKDVFLPEKDREVIGRLALKVNSRGEIMVIKQ